MTQGSITREGRDQDQGGQHDARCRYRRTGLVACPCRRRTRERPCSKMRPMSRRSFARNRTQETSTSAKVVTHVHEAPTCAGSVQPMVRLDAAAGTERSPMAASRVHAVERTPEHEGPAGAVPQAADQEDHHEVAVPRTVLGHAVTAEGDVDVVAEPGAQARCASAARTRGWSSRGRACGSCPSGRSPARVPHRWRCRCSR